MILQSSPLYTAQKIKFTIKDFFSKCDQIRSKLRIWSHLLKEFLMENFIFCAVKDPFSMFDRVLNTFQLPIYFLILSVRGNILIRPCFKRNVYILLQQFFPNHFYVIHNKTKIRSKTFQSHIEVTAKGFKSTTT